MENEILMGFITVEELKSYPIPVTTKQWDQLGDDRLAIAIETASDRLANWLDRRMIIDRYIERYQGSGDERLVLRQYPAATVYAVSSYTAADAQTDWDLDLFRLSTGSAILTFKNRSVYAFTKGQDWVVDYNAGYESLPPVLKHATALQTVQVLQPMFRGGSNFVEVKLIEELDEQIVDMLDELKRRRIA